MAKHYGDFYGTILALVVSEAFNRKSEHCDKPQQYALKEWCGHLLDLDPGLDPDSQTRGGQLHRLVKAAAARWAEDIAEPPIAEGASKTELSQEFLDQVSREFSLARFERRR